MLLFLSYHHFHGVGDFISWSFSENNEPLKVFKARKNLIYGLRCLEYRGKGLEPQRSHSLCLFSGSSLTCREAGNTGSHLQWVWVKGNPAILEAAAKLQIHWSYIWAHSCYRTNTSISASLLLWKHSGKGFWDMCSQGRRMVLPGQQSSTRSL